MEKKRLVSAVLGAIFVAALVFFGVYYTTSNNLTGYVVYNSACDDSQTILRLSSVGNAHGAIYNQSSIGYDIKICYPDVFNGSIYPVSSGANSHQCQASNNIFNLSANYNAHASIGSGSTYTTPVCYGDLVCRNTTSSCDTSAGEVFVVSLSSISNAHLSANETYYSQKICCSSANANPAIPRTGLVANITSPKNGDIYFSESTINFKHNSYTKEGNHITEVKWDLGNGTILSADNFTMAYAQTGARTITLIVKDNSSSTAKDSVEILIAKNGINVFPIINSPEDLSTFRTKSVDFDGQSSYVLNVTKDLNKFDCLGGGCPLKVSGYCGASCPDILNSTGMRGNYSLMLFNWSFGVLVSGQSGIANKSGKVVFVNPGENIVNLKLYSAGEHDEVTNRVFIATTERECTSDRNYYWDGGKFLETINSTGICYLFTPSCCPSGYSCVGHGASTICSDNGCNEFYEDKLLGTSRIELCEHYNFVEEGGNSESQCKADCMNAAANNYNAVKDNLTATNVVHQYSCKWNEQNNKCTFWANVSAKSSSLGGSSPVSTSEIWEISSDSGCQNGQQTVKWCKKSVTLSIAGTINSSSGCLETPETTFSCGSGAIELPFFSSLSLIISIVSICLIYLRFRKNHE